MCAGPRLSAAGARGFGQVSSEAGRCFCVMIFISAEFSPGSTASSVTHVALMSLRFTESLRRGNAVAVH